MAEEKKEGSSARIAVILALLVAATAGFWFYSQYESPEERYATTKERADALISEGSYAEAVEPLRASLDAARDLDPGDPRLDQILNELAEAYGAQGLYVEAQHQYFAAFQNRVEKYGPVHAETAEALFKLGRTYELMEQYDSAEGMYNQALDIWQKLDKPSDPAAMPDYLGLARILVEKEDYSDAAEMHGKALAIEEGRVGKDDPELVPLLNAYAELLERAGRESDAAKVRERSQRLAGATGDEDDEEAPPPAPAEAPQAAAVDTAAAP